MNLTPPPRRQRPMLLCRCAPGERHTTTASRGSTRCMTDIQSSLQRLQESIRGLSDASALVGGALDVDIDVNQDIFQEEQGGVGTSISPPQQQPVSSPNKYHRRRHDDGVDGRGGVRTEPDRRSSLGSSSGSPSHDEERQSMLSSIPRELRDSAEVCVICQLRRVPMPNWSHKRMCSGH